MREHKSSKFFPLFKVENWTAHVQSRCARVANSAASLCIFRSTEIRDSKIRHEWFYARMDGPTRALSDFKRSQQLGNCRNWPADLKCAHDACVTKRANHTRVLYRENLNVHAASMCVLCICVCVGECQKSELKNEWMGK